MRVDLVKLLAQDMHIAADALRRELVRLAGAEDLDALPDEARRHIAHLAPAVAELLGELRTDEAVIGAKKALLLEEIGRLEDNVASFAEDIIVNLDAEQARALAAALDHYADESDRRLR